MLGQETHKRKYRLKGESFKECCTRIASALADNDEHFHSFRKILLEQKFLPAGRVQSAVGSPRTVTAFNCFVSGTIDDSIIGIMDRLKESIQTMRLGGGIGYDFSTIRPADALITTLDAKSSGVLPFMALYDTGCETVRSAGDRRGAQMGVLRVDHPDIEAFVEAKTQLDVFTNFNLSVGITDKFMEAVKSDAKFDLVFDGKVYKTIRATYLWDKIMRATWDWAEPGVLFIDRLNQLNNLYYCEEIAATNPCGEQPLPPYGACLLGSFNMAKIDSVAELKSLIPCVIRAMDNIIDETTYPLPEHEKAAKDKRRMGIGVTGLANFVESIYGYEYGSSEFLEEAEQVFQCLTYEAYKASADLAEEKGAFPLFDKDQYCSGSFVGWLPEDVQERVATKGIRNSHLVSFAPAGTISITADNVSSGIEPVFSLSYTREVTVEGRATTEDVMDYAYKNYGVKGKTACECTVDEHLAVLALATKYSDSAVSKTINVGNDVTWEGFKDIYMKAYELGCKGVTTFRAAGKRMGILIEKPVEGGACYIDPVTGDKSCS